MREKQGAYTVWVLAPAGPAETMETAMRAAMTILENIAIIKKGLKDSKECVGCSDENAEVGDIYMRKKWLQDKYSQADAIVRVWNVFASFPCDQTRRRTL